MSRAADADAATRRYAQRVLAYLEHAAVHNGWFTEHTDGWELINASRAILGKPPIVPVDEPTRKEITGEASRAESR